MTRPVGKYHPFANCQSIELTCSALLNPVSPLAHHHHPAVEFRVCRICFGGREVAGGAGIDIAVFPRAESLRTLASPKVVAVVGVALRGFR
jgi:hypothetical protein